MEPTRPRERRANTSAPIAPTPIVAASIASGPIAAALLALVLVATGCASTPSYRIELPERPEARGAGTILFVLTAAGEQTLSGGGKRATGYFLNEFYEPYRALRDAGYRVVFATPGGRPAVVDPESLDEKYWDSPADLKRAREAIAGLPELEKPLSLAEARARQEEYQGLVVPGGQGVMVDLLDDADLHALLLAYDASDRPVGLICHAPAILARFPERQRPFSGSRVTSVSGFEEWYIETFVMGDEARVRAIGSALGDSGYRHETAFPGSSKAVRDCNLVTSQNPFSGEEFSRYYVEALRDYRQGARCAYDRDD